MCPGPGILFLEHLKCPALTRVELGHSTGTFYQPIIDMVRISACSITVLTLHARYNAENAGISALLQSLPTLKSIILNLHQANLCSINIYSIFDALMDNSQICLSLKSITVNSLKLWPSGDLGLFLNKLFDLLKHRTSIDTLAIGFYSDGKGSCANLLNNAWWNPLIVKLGHLQSARDLSLYTTLDGKICSPF
jgi:hypothetical protein